MTPEAKVVFIDKEAYTPDATALSGVNNEAKQSYRRNFW